MLARGFGMLLQKEKKEGVVKVIGKRTASEKSLIYGEQRLEELGGRLGPEARGDAVGTCGSGGVVVGDGEEIGEGEVPFRLMRETNGKLSKKMSGGGVIDGPVAKNLGPVIGKGGSGCRRVDVVKRAVGVHDVRDRDFGAPGRPQHDPGLQSGLVLTGGGMVLKGVQGAVGGGDGGFGEQSVKAREIERAKSMVEMRAKMRECVKSSVNKMRLTKNSAPKGA